MKDKKETVYDIEMQTTDTKELPKRTRYYQSMVDLQLIDKGQHYKHLKPCYIIFICPFDAFGRGRHKYTFVNLCKEDTKLALEDGATKIFLNADSEMDDVSSELKAFLDYVAGKKSDDMFIEKLELAVKKAKQNREWRHEYMTLLMRDQENIEKGRIEGEKRGRIDGEERMLALIEKLIEEKRFEDISKIKENTTYRQQLYQEYHIMDELTSIH